MLIVCVLGHLVSHVDTLCQVTCVFLEFETSTLKWLFQLDDSKSLHEKWLFQETSIKKSLFGVPASHVLTPRPVTLRATCRDTMSDLSKSSWST